jgi:hypothetical protein
MAIIDLFSKRQRRLRGEMPDVYQYDDIPEPLKVQIVHLIQDALSSEDLLYEFSSICNYVNDVLCREYGLLNLTGSDYSSENNYYNSRDAVINYFLKEELTEKSLNVIEILFQKNNILY